LANYIQYYRYLREAAVEELHEDRLSDQERCDEGEGSQGRWVGGVGKGVAQVAVTETIFLSVVFGHFAKATLNSFVVDRKFSFVRAVPHVNFAIDASQFTEFVSGFARLVHLRKRVTRTRNFYSLDIQAFTIFSVTFETFQGVTKAESESEEENDNLHLGSFRQK